MIAVAISVAMSLLSPLPNTLSVCTATQVTVEPDQMAYLDNTADGSPSLVVMRNLGSSQLAVVVLLGRESLLAQIPPGQQALFPADGPRDFQGVPLYLGNVGPNPGDALKVVLFSSQCPGLRGD